MRNSLETKIEHEEVFGCGVTAAETWILFCGQNLFINLVLIPGTIDPGARESYTIGPLVTEPTLGLPQWRFGEKALPSATERQGARCK